MSVEWVTSFGDGRMKEARYDPNWPGKHSPGFVSVSVIHAMPRRGLRTQPRVSTLGTGPQTKRPHKAQPL
jgi:hypothetical protein